MFGALSIEALQNYWWFLICVLAALLVMQFFIQGGQSLLWQLSSNETEKTMIVNTLGRKWELGFTTLVLFGGAFFASFPLFYATSFGGAYFVWMLILFTFIIQAVSYEYRKKEDNVFGQKTFETFLFIHGIFSVLLIGTAVATFFSGSSFTLNDYRQVTWQGPFRGLEAALSLFNLSLGLALVFLSRILGAQYIIKTVAHEGIAQKARKQILINAIAFLPFFLGFVIALLLRDGYAYDPATGLVSMVSHKYLSNLLDLHVFGIGFFLLGVVLVLFSIFLSYFKESTNGIWFGGLGTMLVVLVVFFIAGYNNTAFYPSYYDLQSSITIRNASSSHFTLKVMSYVSLGIPFVLGYIVVVWRAMTSTPITEKEVNTSHELY